MGTYNISYGYLTSIGKRSINEDFLSFYSTPARSAFVVCDGLVGHGNGDVASKLVAGTMKALLTQGKGMEEALIE